MKPLILFSLLSASFASASETCAPVDLRPLIGPPLHQGDSGYCFAHASSSLIQARLGVRVSPMYLAMGYILANFAEFEGNADPAVKAKLTPELFSFWEKDRNFEPGNYAPDKILTMKGLVNTGGEEPATLLAANFLGLCLESDLPTGKSVYQTYVDRIEAYHRERMRHGVQSEGAIGVITDPDSQAKAWSFRHWVDYHCRKTFAPSQPLVPSWVKFAKNLKELRLKQRLQLATGLGVFQNNVMKAIDEQLDRRNPVSIGYAIGDVEPSDAVTQREAGSLDPNPVDVDHASVIAGRRMRGGKCYYFLRNSFGKETKDYYPKFQGRAESGGVWVLPEELPSLYSAVWLE